MFETLFPRAAERRERRLRQRRQRQLDLFELDQRRKRILRKRQKQAIIKKRKARKPVKIAGPQYYTYRARGLGVVPIAKLAKVFAAQEAVFVARQNAEQDDRIREHFGTRRLNLDSYAQLKPLEPAERINMTDFADAIRGVRLKARTAVGKALVAHYQKSPEPLWVNADGQATANAVALVEVLEAADRFGLAARDYAVPPLPQAMDVRQAAEFEFTLTASALRYMVDAKHGLVDPNRISGYHDFRKNFANHKRMMSALSAAPNPAKLLEDSHPQDPSFAALKAELAAMSDITASTQAPVVIAPGTFIRPGDIDFEIANVVEAIRRRAKETIQNKHVETLAADHSSGEYTPEVVALVRDMQKGLGLKPDGIIGKNTIRRLLGGKNSSPAAKRNKILYAMERLRWHPDSLGKTHVMINQPAYKVALKRGGQTELSMNVVVGKRANQTNFFYDKISYVEFNPYWGVPRSILVNEMLPKLRKNAGYLDNLGYEMTDAKGRYVSSYNVNWWNVGDKFPYNVRQPPGPKNALGRLKIMFPNKHSIYMHDTPAKSLFKRDVRAFSHGCVRLAEPQRMAAAVLGTSVDAVQDNIDQGSNMTRKLKRKIPVYVSYFTAWPNDEGKVRFFSDIYGRDAALEKALKAERRVREADSRA